ncbi:MAG: class I SAM-dependent methyltransferase [Candidatus Paceibacterota bacterium]
MKNSNILVTEKSRDYELIDSGLGEKLERFGKFVLSRPDPQALWPKRLDETSWKLADAVFNRNETKGEWNIKKTLPDRWEVGLAGLKFYIKPTPFKHVGMFPEQSVNWDWMQTKISEKIVEYKDGKEDSETEILNLFGYTGGATLACAKAGAKVVHIDGSKSAMSWGRENAELSGLNDMPIRWILDDAREFVKREIKRERKYDGIVMDPPAFGHGPDNELWKIEDDLSGLIADCFSILKDKPTFFIINGYSAGYSSVAYENMLLPLIAKYGGSIEIGELAIRESGKDGRLLPAGIFARWGI